MTIKKFLQIGLLVAGIGITAESGCVPLKITTSAGESYTVDVKGTDDLSEIRRQLNEQDPTLKNAFRLIFKEKTVGDKGTLLDFLAEGMHLERVRTTFPYFIEDLAGKKYGVELEDSETIAQIRRQLLEKYPELQSNFKLLLEGTLIEEDQTVKELGLAGKGTMHLVKART